MGTLLVVTGSVLLASKGIFAKALYARGLEFETVVALRSVLAIPGFLLIAALLGGLGPLRDCSRRDLTLAALAGLVCYYLGAGVNFYALTLIDASVERALLFSYPALVVIAGWLLHGSRPSAAVVVAVIATYLGIVLVVELFSPDLTRQTLIGAAWVLVCSATIAFYFMISASLTRRMGSARFTVVAMTAAGTGLAAHYQAAIGWQSLALDQSSWLLMMALVALATVLPLYLVAEGVRRVGAQRGAVASTVGPPATAIMAIVLLGESLSVGQLIGMLLIIGGILLLELRHMR